MSHHLLKNEVGHLRRVDGSVYDEGVLLGVLPTHLRRGTDKQIVLTSARACNVSIGITSDTSGLPWADTLPSLTEVSNSLASAYQTKAPGSSWINGSTSGTGYPINYDAEVAYSEVKSTCAGGVVMHYTYRFTSRVFFAFFNWPSGFSSVPGLAFTTSVSFQNRCQSALCFRAFSCDRVYAGGTSLQPRYRYSPFPTTLAALNALPGGLVAQSNLSSKQLSIMGPFDKRGLLAIAIYHTNLVGPYGDPTPSALPDDHLQREYTFSGASYVNIFSSSTSNPNAWVIG